MNTIVVPDAIEPYIGWKALQIEDGYLISPQQQTVWPKQHKLEALCPAAHHHPHWTQHWGWQLERGTPPQTNYYIPGALSDATTTTATPTELVQEWNPQTNVGIYYTNGRTDCTDPPNILPPDGYYWSWQPDKDELLDPIPVASRDCSCGIYVVDSATECSYYFKGGRSVLAKVALWGTVTPAAHGARGQYAYPQQLIIPRNLEPIAAQLATDYQIPHEIFDPGRMATKLGIAKHELPDPQQDAHIAAGALSVAGGTFALLSMIGSLFVNAWVTLAPLLLSTICIILSLVAAKKIRAN